MSVSQDSFDYTKIVHSVKENYGFIYDLKKNNYPHLRPLHLANWQLEVL